MFVKRVKLTKYFQEQDIYLLDVVKREKGRRKWKKNDLIGYWRDINTATKR